MGKKILAIASGGGHWVQMRRLRQAFAGLDVVFVSVKAAYAEEVPGRRFYAVRDVTRWDKWGFVILLFQLLRILWRERPDVVITTGSAPGFIALRLAKQLFGARTMWIDSIANCEQMSSSGLRARRFADVWLTQWPHLASSDGPDCWGAVL
jgi:UDP-N-acetylglucosamine:LPS N-acetylglucosamine transferase